MNYSIIFCLVCLSISTIMFFFPNKIVKLGGKYKGKKGEYTITQRIAWMKLTGLIYMISFLGLTIYFLVK